MGVALSGVVLAEVGGMTAAQLHECVDEVNDSGREINDSAHEVNAADGLCGTSEPDSGPGD